MSGGIDRRGNCPGGNVRSPPLRSMFLSILLLSSVFKRFGNHCRIRKSKIGNRPVGDFVVSCFGHTSIGLVIFYSQSPLFAPYLFVLLPSVVLTADPTIWSSLPLELRPSGASGTFHRALENRLRVPYLQDYWTVSSCDVIY